jgi:hypothetical protein
MCGPVRMGPSFESELHGPRSLSLTPSIPFHGMRAIFLFEVAHGRQARTLYYRRGMAMACHSIHPCPIQFSKGGISIPHRTIEKNMSSCGIFDIS